MPATFMVMNDSGTARAAGASGQSPQDALSAALQGVWQLVGRPGAAQNRMSIMIIMIAIIIGGGAGF